jgi:hypothetical protein
MHGTFGKVLIGFIGRCEQDGTDKQSYGYFDYGKTSAINKIPDIHSNLTVWL